MKRWLWLVAAFGLLATACQFQPLEDPGLGDRGLTSVVYASDGSVLAEWHAEEDRALVTYDELPRYLLDAVVAIEDERYWAHAGVDLQALARALIADLESGSIAEGGSTITQQYLKNVVLTPEVTLDRKLAEAALALRLEEGLSKEDILERYVNTVYLGDGAYGVGTAATHYFGKAAHDLTLGESALLAGLIQSPGTTDPYRNPEAALARRRVVLERMVRLGWATQADAETADQEALVLQPQRPGDVSRFPYFTEEVKRRLLDDPALGETATDRYNALFRGGLRIYTTVDPLVQESAELAVASVIGEEAPYAALAAIDPRTGHVLGLVGGRDFYDQEDPVARFNLATQGARQPGSSFKPFVLASALEKGLSLDHIFQGGSSITVQTDSGPWTVGNYNNASFPDLTLLEATVFSVNVVYAQVVDLVGPEAVVEVAKAAGISSDLQPFHSIALGAQEVSPLDMASGYGTFAAEGIHVDPILVTAIETHDGVNIYAAVPVVTEALSREVAQTLTGALTEVVKRGTGQQARIGRPIAGKTGTSQDHHDAWFVGYTPELVAAVWVGFPEGQISMEPPTTPYTITGGSWPAQIWSRFASGALSGTPYGLLAEADTSGQVAVEVDTSTGFLAGPFCPREHVHRIQVPIDSAPNVICPVHNPAGVVAVGSGELPDVIGYDLGTAVAALNGAGFQVKVDYQDGGALAPGTVFGQNPSAGFPAQAGSTVRLAVAGPEPGSVVPSVVGFPLDHAVADLSALGVTVEVVEVAESNPDDAARRAGVVWKQDPAPGAPATGTVKLWANP
ncbi:MAG: transglycosylase domain-containing protein [Acidimicrobiia bacterium]|nr:transglycosylase domain-containing protein [Acidimicrobiia bacterium]MDH3397670.1 transglycosylase domain-containing protein [Acidimicrobiia bacterium]